MSTLNNVMQLMRADWFAIRHETRGIAGIIGFIVILAAGIGMFHKHVLIGQYFTLTAILLPVATLFKREELYRAAAFQASLPVRRSDIVLARYGEALVITALALVLTALARAILGVVAPPEFLLGAVAPSDFFHPAPSYYADVLSITLLGTGILLTLYFCLGATLASNTAWGLAAVASIVVVIASFILLRPHSATEAIARKFAELAFSRTPGHTASVAILLLLAIIWWVAAIKLSIKLYRKRIL